MTGTMVGVVAAVTLMMTVWSLITTIRDRPMVVPHLVGLAVTELTILVVAGMSVAKLVGGRQPDDLATYLGYLIGVIVIPVVGAAWGVLERSRWGPAVIAVACFSVAVMFVRMLQLWQGGHA